MNATRYILRSVAHYRLSYAGVLAGAILGATVLLGALFAGDSVAKSLRQISEQRTGRATQVITAGDRFFRQALADDLARATRARVAPVLLAQGTANTTAGAAANQVQLVGVTPAFWQMAPTPASVSLPTANAGIAVNALLAQRLNLSVGDTLIVRWQKPGLLAGSAPVAGTQSKLQTLRCTIAAIVDAASFGRFSLETTQVPKPAAFLPIELLQAGFERPNLANLLLLESAREPMNLAEALRRSLQLADYGLSLRWLETASAFELTSNRIFIDPGQSAALTAAIPGAQPVLSYLVNEFRVRTHTTPYSIGTATTPAAAPFLPADLGPQEIVLNDWLAADLQARPGDELRLAYFQVGPNEALLEQSATFRVRAIVPLQGLAADRSWMPEFPGMSEVESARDWDPGLPLDLRRIREQDERYWSDHRGTPKAFLSLAGGRALWSTRWGNTTALRIPFERARESELATTLLGALRPEMHQLIIRDFRAAAVNAAQSPVDFAGLFAGLSFFLIVAALGLVAMLFQLALLQRNREDALLGAVGLPGRTRLRWRLTEGFVILLAGCAAGFALATLYTRGVLAFLESIWAGQDTGRTFVFAAEPRSIAAGAIVFVVLSLFAIWLAIRRLSRQALSIRLAAGSEDHASTGKILRSSKRVLFFAVGAAILAVAYSGRGLPAQGAFFLAGFALLVAGISLCRVWMSSGNVVPPSATDLDVSALARLNLKTRRARNLTVVGLIATAVFMVLSVASFRKHVGDDWLERGSGTGGFAYWVETAAAQSPERDGPAGSFQVFAGHTAALGEVVPIRAGAGDNANCFNLNTVSQPQLLAVPASKLAALDAFTLKLPGENRAGWNVLRPQLVSDVLPALVDETTLLWALKRKVGDVIAYPDENGRPFNVQIVGTLPDSIFQGYLLIDEQAFLQKFPSHPGYSIFLVDAANREAGGLESTRRQLETATRDVGGRVELTRDVLAAFHEIENTYIAIFNVLGSLGVVLGSLGLAIVVARNLNERRGEFGVMSAIGVPHRVLGRLVFLEFGRLVLWGIAIGGAAALLAVWPNLTALPPAPTLALIAGLLAGIVVLNLASGWLVFRWSLRELRPGMLQAV